MNDIFFLSLCNNRDGYERYYNGINQDGLNQYSRDILRCIKSYYDNNTCDDLRGFRAYLSVAYSALVCGPNGELYNQVLNKLEKELPDPDIVASIEKILLKKDLATRLGHALMRFEESSNTDLYAEVKAIITSPKYAFVADSECLNDEALGDWIKDNVDSNGLSWGLKCLNNYFRPVRGGLLGLVAARVNAGKTSFCCTLGVSWAMSLKLTGDCILHFNNEGKSNAILARYVQCATGYSVEDIIQKGKEQVLKDYREVVGDSTIRVVSAHGFSLEQVEKAIESNKPRIVIIDMLEHIELGKVNSTGDRTDQRLETLAQRLRVMAVQYNCFILATVQLSKDAENVPYPELSMLKDSKTGLQAAADAIITIGQSADMSFANTRFLGCVKSKITKTGAYELRDQVIIDRVTGKYTDPTDQIQKDT